VLHLTDLTMFDSTYQCQNIETGAYKLYFIECLNRESKKNFRKKF
jgi:hypothetical protein